MIELTKPDVILTHESDLDGLVSGLLLQRLAQHRFGITPRLQTYHYQNWRNREMRESCAWVADFALDERMDKPGWLVLDHHPLELEPRHAQLVHNLNKSAALLTYELCCEHGLTSPTLDRLVRLANVTDLFLEADPDFALANDYANLVKSYQFWNLHALIDGQLERLLDHPLLEVMAVKRRVEDPLGLAWSRENITALSPTVGLVETVVGNNNLIVHQLLETKATPYAVLVTLFRKANGPVIVSLRSRNGEAVQVAAKLQGGGHPNASGAVLPRSVRTTQDAAQYLKDVLNPVSEGASSLNSLEAAFAALELEKK
jgi:oligoribonuclease NrnB/cAMP/cGMP phosphodiesterase (DHH superfamily)